MQVICCNDEINQQLLILLQCNVVDIPFPHDILDDVGGNGFGNFLHGIVCMIHQELNHFIHYMRGNGINENFLVVVSQHFRHVLGKIACLFADLPLVLVI